MQHEASFPTVRLRRLRRTEVLRGLVRETRLSRHDFILPMFAVEGTGVRRPISSMPGVHQLSIDQLVEDARKAHDAGVAALILFGIPATKDEMATSGWVQDGIIPRAVEALKKALPDLLLVADVCNCEYMSHGHCGIVEGEHVVNDASLDLLAKASLSYARAGVDIVAPSDMMDGRVAAIRRRLDENGFHEIPIMAYSAKYASGFYGPFREAAESAPQFGDRRSYQMDPANRREALREVLQDVQEGADMVMVKPALPYLDVIREVRDLVDMPVAAYNVSGEYSMVKAAALQGWIDEKRVVMEILTGIRRAGADLILTYHAVDAIRWLEEGC